MIKTIKYANEDSLECKLLQSQILSNRVSHAYLFSGQDSSEKIDIAMRFSEAVLYENINFLNDNSKSNDTDSSALYDRQIIYPLGSSSYLVSQIKEIINNVQLSPLYAKKKIYILHDVEKFSSSAANAFLKTLEEPPSYVCFILVCNNDLNVLPTIVSRCQLIKFSPVKKDYGLKILSDNAGASFDDCKFAYDLYSGNIYEAKKYLFDQNLQDFVSEVKHIFFHLNKMTDWQTLQRVNDIIVKINEILNVYKKQLEKKLKLTDDFLDSSSLKLIEEQNKRSLALKKNKLLVLICDTLNLLVRHFINFIASSNADSSNKKNLKNNLQNNNQNNDFIKYFNTMVNYTSIEACINTLKLLSKFEQKLAYNINMQNFCDCVFLGIKNNLYVHS